MKTEQCLGSDEAFMAYYWHHAFAPDRDIYVYPKPLRSLKDDVDAMRKLKPQTFSRIHSGCRDKSFHMFYIEHYEKLNGEKNETKINNAQ